MTQYPWMQQPQTGYQPQQQQLSNLMGTIPPKPQMMQRPGGFGGAPPPQNFGPPNSFGDPYNVYLSTVPMFQDEARKNIQQSMAQAGLSGNRFGTAAQRTAANVGAETANKQQALLQNLLYGQANQDLDRALQASLHGSDIASREKLGFGNLQMQSALGMGNLALGQDEQRRKRMQDLFGVAQYEQGRQDQYSMIPYQEFLQSRMGFIPLLMQLAGSQGAGSQGSPVTTTTGGGPGLIDLASFAANSFPMWGPAAFPNYFKNFFGG